MSACSIFDLEPIPGIEDKNDLRELAANLKRIQAEQYPERAIFCLGECHTKVFSYIGARYRSFKTPIVALPRRGATAAGLPKLRTETKSKLFFSTYLKYVNPAATLIFCFGEVDCNLVIPFRMEKNNSTAEQEIQFCIRNYFTFLDSVRRKGFSRIVLYNVELPSQFTTHHPKNPKRTMRLDIRARTRITVRFNQVLRERCQERGFSFIDLEPRMLDPQTTLVREEFLTGDPSAHNLKLKALAPLVVEELRRLGYD